MANSKLNVLFVGLGLLLVLSQRAVAQGTSNTFCLLFYENGSLLVCLTEDQSAALNLASINCTFSCGPPVRFYQVYVALD